MFNVVLVNPQIPNNTGNIGRLCVASESTLHLIHPLGFEITDTKVKRAGLDYWPDLKLKHYSDWETFLNQHPLEKNRFCFFSAKAEKSFFNNQLQKGDFLVFGKESEGFSAGFFQNYKSLMVKIPFPGKVRSFNLGNTVAMAISEGLRQVL